ncbi:hypothetical protein SLS64_009358 [Diaporthe eres]
MPDSSNPTVQGPAHPASSATFTTNTDEAKIVSYMWYIHVTVRVNAADRLWDRLAHLLGQGTTTTTTAKPADSPPYSPQFDLDGIINAGSRSGSEGRSTPGREGNGAGAANEIDDLTDYLVLQLFSRGMLETLVNTAPVEEHTDGYARVLTGIPAHFREEFCRRLYCLLFSKYILEWPSGIAVPEPAPGSVAAGASSAATASTAAASAGLEAVATSTSSGKATGECSRSSVQVAKEHDEKDELMFDMDEILADEEGGVAFDGENDNYPVSPEPASPGYQSTLGPSSPWPDTPSLGYSPQLARAAYFGTVSTPLPIHYLGDWGRSSSRSSRSRDDGPARAAYARSKAGAGAGEGSGPGASHGERLPPPSDIVDRQYDLRAGRLLAAVVGAEEVFDGVAVRVGLLHRAVRILDMDGVASQRAVPMTGGD